VIQPQPDTLYDTQNKTEYQDENMICLKTLFLY
jgi:hypothetical protein